MCVYNVRQIYHGKKLIPISYEDKRKTIIVLCKLFKVRLSLSSNLTLSEV